MYQPRIPQTSRNEDPIDSEPVDIEVDIPMTDAKLGHNLDYEVNNNNSRPTSSERRGGITLPIGFG